MGDADPGLGKALTQHVERPFPPLRFAPDDA